MMTFIAATAAFMAGLFASRYLPDMSRDGLIDWLVARLQNLKSNAKSALQEDAKQA